jgi:hypothetical protein
VEPVEVEVVVGPVDQVVVAQVVPDFLCFYIRKPWFLFFKRLYNINI